MYLLVPVGLALACFAGRLVLLFLAHEFCIITLHVEHDEDPEG